MRVNCMSGAFTLAAMAVAAIETQAYMLATAIEDTKKPARLASAIAHPLTG